eukprot:TRINITY_DN2463_c0_g1_i1.p1 TRINITY_DN2463_c0_g1~~TRINITY_DN2463_c0_g1_i1.p1  ORF type:complete len:747 (-),score=143.30 TRINITY_DN2463_c0_g1_i1:53-2293(-)
MGFRSQGLAFMQQGHDTLEILRLPEEQRFLSSYAKSFGAARGSFGDRAPFGASSSLSSLISPAKASATQLPRAFAALPVGPPQVLPLVDPGDSGRPGSSSSLCRPRAESGAKTPPQQRRGGSSSQTRLGGGASLARRSRRDAWGCGAPAVGNPPEVRRKTAAPSSRATPGGAAPTTEDYLNHTPRRIRRAAAEVLSRPDIRAIAERSFARRAGSRAGSLRLADACRAIKTLGGELGLSVISDEEADRLFRRFDVNGDENMSFDEFFELFLTMLRRVAFDRSTITGREFFVGKRNEQVWDIWDKAKELGSGTFGTAYLVKHKATREVRVVKAVNKSRAKLPVEDIEREIMIMRQIDHPHVVRLFMWFEDETKVYLVMEALMGGTLKDVILGFQKQRCGVKENWSRKVIHQVLDAMTYCHSLRLIHKDIKDENIMLLEKGKGFDEPFAVVIDLGIAEMFSPADPQGREVGGTPLTMAPEVWEGSFGPKCDVWSVGCVLFELLTGQMPFCATSLNANAWLRLHKRGPDWSLVRTSSASRDLCQLMLTFHAQRRPSMAECRGSPWFSAHDVGLGVVSAEQFEELHKFCQDTALKRTMLLEIASRLPMNKAGEIVDMFSRFDVNGDSSLSEKELQKTFSDMGINDTAVVQRVFETLDVDKDGLLSFSEFAAGVLVLFKDLLDERLRTLFKRRDRDGNGYLDYNEAKEFLANATCMLCEVANKRSFDMLEELLQGGQTKIRYEDIREKLLGS